MAQSGVKCNEQIKQHFNALQLNKQFRYFCMAIEDEGSSKGKPAEVVIDEEGAAAKFKVDPENKEKHGETADLVTQLKEYLEGVGRPRYCVFDVRELVQGALKTKIIFILWNLDSYKIRDKMRYASTKDAVVKECQGIHRVLQISEPSDLNAEALIDMLK